MDLRTPLARVRGLGSARGGTAHFWRQRLTAIANIPLILYFVWLIVVSLAGKPHGEAIAALASPLNSVAMILVLVSAIIHMRLGMQAIIEDYVQGEGMKVALLIANTFFSFAVGSFCVLTILKLALGG